MKKLFTETDREVLLNIVEKYRMRETIYKLASIARELKFSDIPEILESVSESMPE